MEGYVGITGKRSSPISVVFFVFGLIGALGFRVILLLNKINYLLASVAWYISILAYLVFYSYRLYIVDKRRKVIMVFGLREKLGDNKLSYEDRRRLRMVLDSLLVSKFKWNLIILIILTALALIAQIVVDIFFGV